MGITTNEFPLLGAAGLYVSETLGNGMLIFNYFNGFRSAAGLVHDY